MTLRVFAPVNGINIYHVQDIIPVNHEYWKYLANALLQRMHELMDACEVLEWICDNIGSEDSWRVIFNKEYLKLEELEAEM
jgi:hypothetical protein